jgi:ribose transport system permease protein
MTRTPLRWEVKAMRRPALRADRLREYGIVAGFVVLFVALSLSTSTFLTSANLVNVLDQSSIVGIIACGEALCIIAGTFDLSVASIAALAGIFTVQLSNRLGVAPAVVLGVLAGSGLGFVNGIAVCYGRVNSFIATLASSIVMTGIATVVTNGQVVSTTHLSFSGLSEPTTLAQITVPTWMWLGVTVITGLLLYRTTFGRGIYAVGGNADAARLSGLRTNGIRIAVFMISGACAALAGIALCSRTLSAEATTGSGLQLTAIAAVVVGGTSILGGEGAVWRATLGVLILGVIGNGFDLLGINSTYQEVAQGGLILAAVMLDQFLRRRRA